MSPFFYQAVALSNDGSSGKVHALFCTVVEAMIDPATGTVHLDGLPPLSGKTDYGEALSLDLGAGTSTRDMGNGWQWIRTQNLASGGYRFNISFGFFQRRLRQLSFTSSRAEDNENGDWSSWSEEGELAELAFYNEWLTAELGDRRAFDWGAVWASFDRKGGSSSIGLRYHDEQ